MKKIIYIKTVMIISFLMVSTFISAQDWQHWWTNEEKTTYNDIEYILRYYTDSDYPRCEMTNNSFDFPSDFTNVKPDAAERKGEWKYLPKDWDLHMARVNKKKNEVDSIARKFFSIDPSREGLSIEAYYDVKTSDYVGLGAVTFSYNIKDRVTPEKLWQLNQLLLNSHINAGTWVFVDPTKKYFVL